VRRHGCRFQATDLRWGGSEEAGLDQHTIDPLAQEMADHTAFCTGAFASLYRTHRNPEKMIAYIKSNTHDPLAIFGEGGSGKSALMAHIFKRISEKNPHVAVVPRFMGATPSSSNIFTLLESLCKHIAGQYGLEASTPTEYKEPIVPNSAPKRYILKIKTQQKHPAGKPQMFM
jgi:hypothetical protein